MEELYLEVQQKLNSVEKVYAGVSSSTEVNDRYQNYKKHQVLMSAYSYYEDPAFMRITAYYLKEACKCKTAFSVLQKAGEVYDDKYLPLLQETMRESILEDAKPVQKKIAKI